MKIRRHFKRLIKQKKIFEVKVFFNFVLAYLVCKCHRKKERETS